MAVLGVRVGAVGVARRARLARRLASSGLHVEVTGDDEIPQVAQTRGAVVATPVVVAFDHIVRGGRRGNHPQLVETQGENPQGHNERQPGSEDKGRGV